MNTKLSFAEIKDFFTSRKIDRLFSILENALVEAEKKVYIKVTRSRNPNADFTLIVNGTVAIDLVKFPTNKLKSSLAIAPNSEMVGKEHVPKENVFIVLPEKYEQFRRDAEKIYLEYCQEGLNFGWIPYTWFSNLPLIHFVINKMWDSPYFQERLATEHMEVSVDWTREQNSL